MPTAGPSHAISQALALDLLALPDAEFPAAWRSLKKHQRDKIPEPERGQCFDRYGQLLNMPSDPTISYRETGSRPFDLDINTAQTALDALQDDDAPPDADALEQPRKRNGEAYIASGAPSIIEPSITAASLGIISRRLSDVPMRPINWLWKDKIPAGKVSMIVGNPGLGKSQICASLAAIITIGGKWPVTREDAPSGSVIILSAEDDADDTIGPRMEASGADLSKIHILDAIRIDGEDGTEATRSFSITADITRLLTLMREIGDVRLVIVDPISAYLGVLDSHKNSDVRGAMALLKDAASEIGAGIIIVNHLNKSQGQDALLKSQGSVGFVAAARAVWGVARDKDNAHRRLFMPLKNNLGTDETGLAYSIESHQLIASDPPILTSRILWESQPVELSAEEVFAHHPDEEQNATAEAKAYLQDALSHGPVKVQALMVSSRKAGHNWPTVKRAKQQLKIVSRRTGGISEEGSWVWELPANSATTYANREN